MRYFKNKNNEIYSYDDDIEDAKIKVGLKEVTETEFQSYTLFKVFDKTKDEIKAKEKEIEVEKAKKEAKLKRKNEGEVYPGTKYKIPFTSKDALGLLQVKSAFELGIASTNMMFSNGTVMPIKASEFKNFAIWFAMKRNSFFVN